jgi:cyclic pyranopterin phosphate synthase
VEICRAAVELGIVKIRVTGGEPLVRKGIVELCANLAALDIDELCLTTNGILLEQFAEPLKLAGVDRVNVSLDTLDADKYRKLTRGGDLSAVLRGIDAAKRAGLTPVKINAVLIKGVNDTEIDRFYELDNVEPRFIELMPIGESKEHWRERYFTLDSNKHKVISPISRKFCGACNRLRLTADGKLKPCLHSRDEYNVRGLRVEELKAAILNAAAAKPQMHLLETGATNSQRGMNRIGG